MDDVNLRIAPSLCALYLDVCMCTRVRACVYTLHVRYKTRALRAPRLVGRLERINVEHARVTNGILYSRYDWMEIIS